MSSGVGDSLFSGCMLLLTWTWTPGLSLKTPEVTTSSPALTPDRMATRSPRDSPTLTNLLAHSPIRLVIGALHVLDDINNIPIRRELDRRCWKDNVARLLGQRHLGVYKHSRAQKAFGIRQRRLNPDVAGRLVDHGVHSVDLTLEFDVGQTVCTDADWLTCCNLAEILLRQPKIHVDGIERLQRRDLGTTLKVLAKVDCADTEHSTERSANRLLVDERFDLLNPRHGLIVLRLGTVVVRLRTHATLEQVLLTQEVRSEPAASGPPPNATGPAPG